MTTAQRETLERIINRGLEENPADSAQHLVTLFGIALSLRAKNILELGARNGGTTEPLVLAASFTGGHVTSVDCATAGWVPVEGMEKHYSFVRADAVHFLSEAKDRYDLVFVDDWHACAHVKRELMLLDKLTDKRSVILLHDLMAGDTSPDYFCPNDAKYDGGEWAGGGPFKAVSELDPAVWEWSTIPVNNGLTILRKK